MPHTDLHSARTNLEENLLAMATGSYLDPAEREYWDPPYSERGVADMMAAVDSMIDAVLAAPRQQLDAMGEAPVGTATPDGELVVDTDPEGGIDPNSPVGAMWAGVLKMNEISDAHGGLLLDTEELDDVLSIIDALSTATGTDHGIARQVVINAVEE